MVKKILKKVNFLILIGCVVMFILSANSLINIDAADLNLLHLMAVMFPINLLQLIFLMQKKVSILPMKVNMLVEVQFY